MEEVELICGKIVTREEEKKINQGAIDPCEGCDMKMDCFAC